MLKEIVSFLSKDKDFDMFEWDGEEALLYSSQSNSNPFSATEFIAGSKTRILLEDAEYFFESNKYPKPIRIAIPSK